MKSVLKPTDIEDFYIRLYFNPGQDYIAAAIKRAYRDFNRTLRDLPTNKQEWDSHRQELQNTLQARVQIVLTKAFTSDKEFCLWHQKTCEDLFAVSGKVLKIGQAQKWINMTLKYLVALGESRVPGIARNYPLFHIPIDNIIQKRFATKYGIEPIKSYAWSRIPTYEVYLSYQKQVKNAFKDKIPLDVEFLEFNGLE